jgi:hypothetical protein
MKAQEFTIGKLADVLCGKRIECAFLTPYLKTDDFESCQAFVQFEDKTILHLGFIDNQDLIEYPVCGLELQKLRRVESVDNVSINGLLVRGLYFSESVFSLGIVVNAPSLAVLCLDTMAGVRMELYLCPLESIKSHDGVIYE